MATLTFPVLPVGMVCDLLIGLDGKTTSALVVAGEAIATPIRCRGLIDTGSDVTCVSDAVLRRLALHVPNLTSQTLGTTGQAAVNLYEVSASVQDFNLPHGPKLVFADLLVMELPAAIPGLDVLIGMDVLLNARLVLDGPRRQFSLEF